jgi:hypothetical protein
MTERSQEDTRVYGWKAIGAVCGVHPNTVRNWWNKVPAFTKIVGKDTISNRMFSTRERLMGFMDGKNRGELT